METVWIICAIVLGVGALATIGIRAFPKVKTMFTAKDYGKLVQLVLANMKTAATKFETNAEKKAWVMAMLRTNADQLEVELTEEEVEQISNMVDGICSLAKVLRNK